MCYHKFNEETTVINLTLRPTVNPLPVPNRNDMNPQYRPDDSDFAAKLRIKINIFKEEKV